MDPAAILPEAERIAREAGELLLGYVGRSLEVERKGVVDLVTEADRASEERIVAEVRRVFPDHAILAEEGGRQGAGSGPLWVIDPLDGTTNFANGLPIWSVSIALMEDGVPVVGVVLDPSRGECFTAARGGGAFRNGERISVSGCDDLDRAVLVTGFPYDVRTSPVNNLDHFANFARTARAVRRLGSAAIDLCWVAAGRFDGFWELKLKPWDLAAGVLLVEEAGGRLARFDGSAFDVFSDEVVAGPEALLPAMFEVLARGRRPVPS
jgi:myo-inositol-1(or 4)-monophosphatase